MSSPTGGAAMQKGMARAPAMQKWALSLPERVDLLKLGSSRKSGFLLK